MKGEREYTDNGHFDWEGTIVGNHVDSVGTIEIAAPGASLKHNVDELIKDNPDANSILERLRSLGKEHEALVSAGKIIFVVGATAAAIKGYQTIKEHQQKGKSRNPLDKLLHKD